MSQEAVTGFWDRVGTDRELAQEFDSLLSSGEQPTVPAQRIVELGASHGFDFSEAELKASLAADSPLSDSDLEQVAGGIKAESKIDGVERSLGIKSFILFR